MTHIGGFFELEPLVQRGEQQVCSKMHADALALSTGRAALRVMLDRLQATCVYLPHYTCDAAFAPMREDNIEVRFYAIDRSFLPTSDIQLSRGEYLLYTNFFGLCDTAVTRLTRMYGDRLLVDDTHGFFCGRRTGAWSFTSARKYFGVPDGAFLYAPIGKHVFTDEIPGPFPHFSTAHLELRRDGQQERAFAAFQAYEASLDCRVFSMSDYTAARFAHIDFEDAARKRRQNFLQLHDSLGATNQLPWDLEDEVPFCYPYLPPTPIDRKRYYEACIYPPTLWPDVCQRSAPEWEQELTSHMLALPIDHRYGAKEMQRIVELTLSPRA
ncbi:MAG: hypothetical protein AAF756_10435 [Pseudomonadota bacterium]